MARTQDTPAQRVLRYIKEQHLTAPGQKLVVAVSGGPDSVCLLHILAGLRREMGIELHVAHLNHRLRGRESDADAAYVAGLARRLGIPATIEARDVKSYRARHHLSTEEAAREVRYTFLAGVAGSTGAASVVVGHTAADHCETILMHLVRGSGTRGLRGLLPLNTWRSAGTAVTVIRPLLEITRGETAAYCRRHRLHPRLDITNLSTGPFRNRIRHELLPLLQDYNPQIAGALERAARIAADELEFIAQEAGRRRGDLMRQEGAVVIIEKKKFLELPPTLQRYLLRDALESLRGDLKDIEARHIEEVLAALDKPSGKVIGLPGGLHFTIEPDRYVLAPDAAAACPFPALDGEYTLKVPGRTDLPGGVMSASVASLAAVKDKIGAAGSFTAFFDYEKTGRPLTVRCRRRGDRFQPLGLESPKRLSTFLIDARVPRAWRERLPVVAAPGQIIWVVGLRSDGRLKVTAGTRRVLRLEFRRT